MIGRIKCLLIRRQCHFLLYVGFARSTIASVVFKQALFEITGIAGVVDRLVRLAHQDINVKKSLI